MEIGQIIYESTIVDSKNIWNKSSFQTLDEALAYTPSENDWNDEIFSGKLTGWKIK